MKRKFVLCHMYKGVYTYCIIYLKNIYFDINAYTEQTHASFLPQMSISNIEVSTYNSFFSVWDLSYIFIKGRQNICVSIGYFHFGKYVENDKDFGIYNLFYHFFFSPKCYLELSSYDSIYYESFAICIQICIYETEGYRLIDYTKK